ncbi:MAG: S1 RNA-binding domain-containing protein [Planctomycetes bacterium]|jgi:ribosomal protein S1|nr:S1 RNA-binding domain-containing protein [Planctomycetota bacterium]
MAEEITNASSEQAENEEQFKALLESQTIKVPRVKDLVKGTVIAASKSEVKLDIDGIFTGVVRGPELYEEDEEYADLQPGDEVEATVIGGENENGELELSFRYAGQEKAWVGLREAYREKKAIKVKVVDANKGGVLVKYRQIAGFLPVSQLAPENYPRVNGGDKGKILERLRSFVNKEFTVKVMTLQEKEDKIIFSEKEAWNERQKDVISQYKVGTVVAGTITAITDFGIFISFGENLEGLIHISELAWQRIDDPADLFKVGDTIRAEVISIDNAKIFLSAKKLVNDPWNEVEEKYKIGQTVTGTVLKINPFGLFVKLDDHIHGLAHVSQLNLAPRERINDKFKPGEKTPFEIVSIEPKDHRLGLAFTEKKAKAVEAAPAQAESKNEGKKEEKEEKTGVKKAKKAAAEKKPKKPVVKKAEKKDKK